VMMTSPPFSCLFLSSSSPTLPLLLFSSSPACRMKEYLSSYWAGKLKKPELPIVKEWKTKYLGLTEAVAKFRYLQLFRSLKTYGYTFYTVKEKRGTGAGKKKIKTLPVLLGINKDTIVRFDPDSRETLQTWPLNHLRRWNATPTSFTFDFGDYETEYYVVQTMEGEAMSQLIGGYIDLLLKMRQKGSAKTQENTGVVATEEMVGATVGAAAVAYSAGFGQPGFMPQVQQYYYQMMNTGKSLSLLLFSFLLSSLLLLLLLFQYPYARVLSSTCHRFHASSIPRADANGTYGYRSRNGTRRGSNAYDEHRFGFSFQCCYEHVE
jgi:hypothetical protein